MTTVLFRKEVLLARRGATFGGIALVRPLPTRWLAGAATISAALVILFLVFATYTRRASVAGHLVPTRGLASVVAPMRGVVVELGVEEGSSVRMDQVLGRLHLPVSMVDGGDTITDLRERLRERRAGLKAGQAARAELLQIRANGLRAQRHAALEEQERITAEMAARQHQLRLADESLARLLALHVQRFVSAAQVEQQQNAVLEATSQVESTRRMAAASLRVHAQLDQELAELPGQQLAGDAEYRRAQALLAQEELEIRARGGQALKAPVAGVVASLLVKAGQAVEAGQPLLSVLPADEALEAELWVPSRSIGFVSPGDRVMLRYQAFPHQKFGHQQGTVRRISRSALAERELHALAGNGAGEEPHYRVIVELPRQAVIAYGRPEPLRPGMLLDADILGERRRLIEWLFEPLYALRGRVGAPP